MDTHNSAETPLQDIWQSLKKWRPTFIQWLSIGLAIAIAVILIRYQHQVKGLGRFGYPGIFVISVLGNATVGAPAPSIIAILGIGATLSVWPASLAAGIGSALGEMLSYIFGYSTHTNWNFDLFGYKFGSKQAVESELSAKSWFKRLARLINGRSGWLTLFVLAAIPNPIFDIGGILAGLAKMPWWLFFSVTTAGKTVRYLILIWLFKSQLL
ncbi:MAG: YqaA family protein [Candidatus Promineifilaceae bacterium]